MVNSSQLVGKKKGTFLLVLYSLKSLKVSQKFSHSHCLHQDIQTVSFTGKLIHAATESELSYLNILIRQLKRFKPVRVEHRGKVLNINVLLLLRRLIRKRTMNCMLFCFVCPVSVNGLCRA